jgi:DNA-binding beta-propeller fold protein YncE
MWRTVLAVTALAAAVLMPALSAAGAQAAGSVYVTNVSDESISQYGIGAGGVLSPLSPPMVTAGHPSGPTSIVVSPDGRSAYATCNVATFHSTICQFTVDSRTGALSPKTPATVAGGNFPFRIAISPDGKNVYVANNDDLAVSNVSQYSADPKDGTLSPKAPATVPAGVSPDGLVVNPDGTSAYVVNNGDNTVSQYSVNPVSGALSPKSPATVATGTTPNEIAVTPDGRSVYVSNANDNTVSQYEVGSDGALTPKTPSTVPTGDQPLGVTVSPNGKSAYVADSLAGAVSEYDVRADGTLTAKAPESVPTGHPPFGPVLIAVSLDGRSAYVTNFSVQTVTQFSINPLTGVLSLKSPPDVATGFIPEGIAAGPLPRVPTIKDQCKNGGWRNFGAFKNQGDCVSFVATKGKNPPSGP